MSRHHVMVIAGEPSGDLHGAGLIKALLDKDPSLKISGIGGDLMAQQGMALFFHIKELSAMGVTEVLRQFKQIKKAFNLFRCRITLDKPDLLILIDYPGFNLKAAAYAKKNSIPVLYYVLPKVWAWKKSRLGKIKQCVDHAALIFPFEERIFKKENIPCTFVGNPLLDHFTDQHPYQRNEFGSNSFAFSSMLTAKGVEAQQERCSKSIVARNATENQIGKKREGELIVGLLPGSRLSEIASLMEIMLKSCRMIQQQFPTISFLVSLSSSIENDPQKASLFHQLIAQYSPDANVHIVPGSPEKLLACSDLLIAASGTVTLEAAIREVPMIIIYRVSPVTYSLASRFVTIPHVGLPNIIAGYEVVPELIQEDATPERIYQEAFSMISDPDGLKKTRLRLCMLKNRLGGAGASKKTARIAMQMLENRGERI